MVGKIVSVPKPLTERQQQMLVDYRLRAQGEGRPLTKKQEEAWHQLESKLIDSQQYKLTSGAMKELEEIVFYDMWGRMKILEAKEMDKGILAEKQSRDILSRLEGVRYVSDDERKTNDWVTGKRDIKSDDIIIDIKSTWDFVSFSSKKIDAYNEIYLRQLDCYMELWDIPVARLAHVLVNTPFRLIEDEIKRQSWKKMMMDHEGNVYDENIPDVVAIVADHIFDRQYLEYYINGLPQEANELLDPKEQWYGSSMVELKWFKDFVEIPEKDRVIYVDHELQSERLEQRNECIKIAREYMNQSIINQEKQAA
jgi:hypothetical protein